MSYIGVPPQATFSSGLLDRFTSTTGTTVTLTHDIASENDIVVFVNFVKQDSTTYSVGGTGNKTLTLGGTLVSSDIVEVHYLNIVGQTNAPSAGSVGSSQLTADSITGQTAETSIADDDTIIIHDTSASSLKKMTKANFTSGIGGVNTPYFYAYKSSEQTGLTNDADTKYQADTEGFDSDGCYNNTGSTVTLNSISTPSYSFAPNVAGKYLLFGSLLLSSAQQGDGREGALRFFKNGSGLNFVESTGNYTSYSFKKFRITSEIIVDANGTSDYFHITGRIVFNTSGKIQGQNEGSYFGAFKIIE